MNGFAERIRNDLIKLDKLSKVTKGKVKILKKTGDPVTRLEIALDYVTAPSKDYPRARQKTTVAIIDFTSQYPHKEPSVKISTPILHPNVYESGRICFGTKWIVSEGLDLFVKRIIKIITFDPVLLNSESPANSKALIWYERLINSHPEYFPTDKVSFDPEGHKSSIKWNTVKGKKEKSFI